MLRFIQTKDEQMKILQACHVDATAGHMGKTRYHLQDKGEIHVAWDGEGCEGVGRFSRLHYISMHPVQWVTLHTI